MLKKTDQINSEASVKSSNDKLSSDPVLDRRFMVAPMMDRVD
ncbi:hypothetical protein [Endozoicomonas sp. SCSIO W0465]|nr:hypothetical protein [Endozoicomonas sp. SCSIO W0465]